MIDPLFPLVPSLVVAVVVLAILVYIEIRRRLRFLLFRIIAEVLLVFSVLLLTLRPSLDQRETRNSKLLLTEGYEQSTIDSLRSLDPVSFKSYNELSKINGVSVIAGHGLPSWALDLLPSNNYKFIEAPQPTGITAIETDEHIYAHRWNEIRGTYNGSEAMIKLKGPGGYDDSVKIANGPFRLSFFAKAPGRFNYEVISNGTTEVLPLVIEPEHTFNIIFISDYPTFEMRYLKNFLASKGHRLSIRNQVSKGLYMFEFANRRSANFQQLTPALLNGTDLVIIDERSWQKLASSEQKNIRTAIADGLGVIMMPDDDKAQLIQFKKTQQKDTVTISQGKIFSIQLPALALEAPGTNPVLKGADNRIVNGFTFSGSGKIGYQLLMETYQAGLQGKPEVYSALWVPLLEKCARRIKNDFKLKITSAFPYYENEPISFDVISSGKEPKLTIDNISFPLTEDVYIDDLWHGTTWLDANQWHELTVDSTTTAIHPSKPGTWRSVAATSYREATASRAGQQASSDQSIVSTDDRLPKIILFVIFILSAGFLWLAPKL